MGLDMWLYKMKKLKEEKIHSISGMKKEDILEKYPNIMIFNTDDENHPEISDIMSILTKTVIKFDFLDMENIKKDFSISGDEICWGRTYSKNTISLEFHKPGEFKNSHTVTFNTGEYVKTEEKTAFVCEYEEAGYLRKAYDVQDYFYEKYAIMNCGYHPVSEEDVAVFLGEADVPELEEGEIFVYHEWW